MLDRAVAGSGLDSLFDEHLSTDRVRAVARSRAYSSWGFWKLPREPSHSRPSEAGTQPGRDAYGYPTFWVNHRRTRPNGSALLADASGATLTELAAWVRTTRG